MNSNIVSNTKEMQQEQKNVKQNFYDVLGVEPCGTSSKEIKKKYFALSRKWHPDKNPDVKGNIEATKKMQEINNAKDSLFKLEERKKYDKSLNLQCPEFYMVKKSGESYDLEKFDYSKEYDETYSKYSLQTDNNGYQIKKEKVLQSGGNRKTRHPRKRTRKTFRKRVVE
jgi:curved DNA-binding protein CbpA